MKRQKDRRPHKMLWGFIYCLTFLVVFIVSAVVKMTYNPLAKDFSYQWDDSVGKIYTDLSYGDAEANRFDLYVPADHSKETYGLIVYLHAGGFTTGDKSDDADMLKRFCSMGYVAAGINYTLRDHNHPEASVYAQSQEIKASIPAVVAEAEKLGYKLDRMAMSGGSAGGCLALLYAYRDADTSPIPVKLVFEMVGPSSFYPEDWVPYGLDKDLDAAAGLFGIMAGKTITADMFGTPAYEEAIKDISAYMWIDENSVPTLCAYGRYDKVCPFDSTKHLIRALQENHVPYDYIEFPHSGHGLQNDNKLYVEYMNKMNTYLDQYMG